MVVLTTTIGAYPKPPELPVVDWFSGESTMGPEARLATNELLAKGAAELGLRLERVLPAEMPAS